jgi:hypothetical protein
VGRRGVFYLFRDFYLPTWRLEEGGRAAPGVPSPSPVSKLNLLYTERRKTKKEIRKQVDMRTRGGGEGRTN